MDGSNAPVTGSMVPGWLASLNTPPGGVAIVGRIAAASVQIDVNPYARSTTLALTFTVNEQST